MMADPSPAIAARSHQNGYARRVQRVASISLVVVASVVVALAGCGGEPAPDIPMSVSPSGESGARAYALEALAGDPRHRDVARALTMLGVECDRGDVRACVEHALALELYDGRPAALGEAMRRYEDVCRRTSVTPCVAEKDPRARRATDVLALDDGHAFRERDACGANASVEMLACYNLSELYARGVVTAPDSADAAALRKKACAGGFRRAC
jgi:hypothetical protein